MAQLGWTIKCFFIQMKMKPCSSSSWQGRKTSLTTISKKKPYSSWQIYTKLTPNYVPFPGTGEIPHNLQSTERPKQILGRRVFVYLWALC